MPNNTILDEVYAATLAHIAALEADTRTDYISAWDHGLGVKINKYGTPIATQLHLADDAGTVYAQTGGAAVYNGKMEPSLSVNRQEAIAAYLPTLRHSAAQIKAAIDQHQAAIAKALPKQVVSAA